MVIVVVRWYIKIGFEEDFKSTWKNMSPRYKDGLFREFFSKSTEKQDLKYHTLDFESKHYTTYINVGIWRSLEDFENAIGEMIPSRDNHPVESNKELIVVFNFEYKLRERIVMDVEKIKGGNWDIPTSDF
jgi:heme-degrading monooxygenase HmoA